MSSADKEIMSFLGIGLMLLASVIVTFARVKTKGLIKLILSVIAFVMLLFGFFYGILAIL
ncbi:hypothetical protein SY83_18655 [Paenibacillus swuensis]|uniref:DUF2768 domain-containing protein n=2 Tax=Paenibacillus swuensis TaxID=1178515 RepID=A0A172TPS9_9BACL|nr:hypothetical protein SY83_18655 [Paenibacillus swuensis]